jgi:hypothetical protein
VFTAWRNNTKIKLAFIVGSLRLKSVYRIVNYNVCLCLEYNKSFKILRWRTFKNIFSSQKSMKSKVRWHCKQICICIWIAHNYSYNTLLLTRRLIDAWMKDTDNGKMIGPIFLDFRKVFHLVDHEILMHKLKLFHFLGKALTFYRLACRWLTPFILLGSGVKWNKQTNKQTNKLSPS